MLEAEADAIADLLGEHAPALNEEGVAQDPESERVVSIILPNRGLRITGPIPGSIGCLEKLTVIDLSNSKVALHEDRVYLVSVNPNITSQSDKCKILRMCAIN